MESQTPKHIAIILDGNRRFAKRLMLEPWKGHEFGRKKVEEILDYAKDFEIKQLTFYTLSLENLKSRPKNELEFLFKLFKDAFLNLDKEKIKNDKIKINFIGKLELLPSELQEICFKLQEETKGNNNFIINICIAYGGRQEITEAVKKIIKNKTPAEKINEEIINKSLLIQDEPEFIIRTGGEIRTSNFLSWQSAYSEWIFLDKMWPEFEKEDLKNCIEEFKKRKRNFGR